MREVASPLSTPLFATALLLVAAGSGRAQARPPAENPLVAALEKDVAHGGAGALARFWTTAAARGTPLVDTVAGDPRHLLATFLFRSERDTRAVVLVAGQTTEAL